MALASIVLEQMGTGVIAVDHTGLVTLCNRAAQEILGVSADQVLWRSCASLAGSDEPVRTIADALCAGLASGRSRARVQLEVDTTGGRRVLGYGLHVLGDPAIVAMIFTDLTETLERERRAHAERHVADAGRLASAMAHELKSPLATIGLYVDLLRRQLPADAPALGNLDVIAAELADCQSRLSTILHSMIGAATGASGLRLSSLAGAIAAIVEEQRLRAPQTELHLTVSGDGRVALDHAGLSSIVGNLVSNAVEVGDGAGPVEVTMNCGHGTALVSVADRGPGLPGGDVFAPFFSTKAQGTGLGLWLVRRLALEAGGDVTATDRAGSGAVFTVRLPVADRTRLAGRRVVVVDDDENLTSALAAALRDAGCAVDPAARAEDIIGITASWRFDCAVLDYRLPGIDGVEAATRLPGLPVIVISSDETAAAALASSGRENAWFMAKPFPVEDLLDALSLLVERRS
jgi:signal transduction histidine kinase/CheY-like chemotaxis protein